MTPTSRLYIIRGLTDVLKSEPEFPEVVKLCSFCFKFIALDKGLDDDIGLGLVTELRLEQFELAILPVELERDIGEYLDEFNDYFSKGD